MTFVCVKKATAKNSGATTRPARTIVWRDVLLRRHEEEIRGPNRGRSVRPRMNAEIFSDNEKRMFAEKLIRSGKPLKLIPRGHRC